MPYQFSDRLIGVAIAQNEIPTQGAVRYATGSASTNELARIRAAGETVERLAASQVRVDWKGSRRDIDSAIGVPMIDRLFPLSGAAYEDALSSLRPFDNNTTYEWVLGQKPDGSSSAVPVECVFYPLGSSTFDRPLIGRATSSGVSAGSDWESAAKAALMELVERDAFVRAWREGAPPNILLDAPNWLDRARRDIWDPAGVRVIVQVYEAVAPTVGVALISEVFPCLSFGMATRLDADSAVEKAYDEACASYAFALSQRGIARPKEIRRPIDHAARYWEPDNFELVSHYFEGKEGVIPTLAEPEFEGIWGSTSFFDITPALGPATVVRAINDSLEPIWFGEHSAPPGADPLHFFP